MNHKPFFNSLAASKLKACDVTFCLVAALINVSLLFVTFILRFKFGVGTRTQQPWSQSDDVLVYERIYYSCVSCDHISTTGSDLKYKNNVKKGKREKNEYERQLKKPNENGRTQDILILKLGMQESYFLSHIQVCWTLLERTEESQSQLVTADMQLPQALYIYN